MSRCLARFPHLNCVIARQRRQLLSDLLIWSLLVAGLVMTFLAA